MLHVKSGLWPVLQAGHPGHRTSGALSFLWGRRWQATPVCAASRLLFKWPLHLSPSSPCSYEAVRSYCWLLENATYANLSRDDWIGLEPTLKPISEHHGLPSLPRKSVGVTKEKSPPGLRPDYSISYRKKSVGLSERSSQKGLSSISHSLFKFVPTQQNTLQRSCYAKPQPVGSASKI